MSVKDGFWLLMFESGVMPFRHGNEVATHSVTVVVEGFESGVMPFRHGNISTGKLLLLRSLGSNQE